MATVKSIPSSAFTPAQRQYLTWLRATFPKLYQTAMAKAGLPADGLGDFDWGGMFSNIVDTVSKAAPAILQLRQQKKLLDVQTKRAKEGYPPMSAEEYARYATPAVEYSTELPSGSMPMTVLPRTGGMDTGKLLLWGGLAVAGVLVLMTMMKRK